MVELNEQVTVRVTSDDVKLLRATAKEQQRSIAWVAREAMREGLKKNVSGAATDGNAGQSRSD